MKLVKWMEAELGDCESTRIICKQRQHLEKLFLYLKFNIS